MKEFDLTPYVPLRAELLRDGIQCGINSRHQITISTQIGPIWPDRGCSFWVTCATGDWHIFPWYHSGYSVPDRSRLAELCRVCMQLSDRALGALPADVVDEFQLQPLTEAEAEHVHHSMATAP